MVLDENFFDSFKKVTKELGLTTASDGPAPSVLHPTVAANARQVLEEVEDRTGPIAA